MCGCAESLGLLTQPVEAELESDRAELAAWMAELRRVGLLGDDEDDPETDRSRALPVSGPNAVAAAGGGAARRGG